jgi:fructan beta-fructosidase
MNDGAKKTWVLIVNLNPGGPNKGSATQYFTGAFDGKKFTPSDTKTRWLDYGPDEYAGVTWSNTGNRKIFLGWMSNWLYANKVPTETWRNAMTIPRELTLKHVGTEVLLSSEPVKELSIIQSRPVSVTNITINHSLDIAEKMGKIKFPCRLNLTIGELKDFSIVLSNQKGEKLIIGYDKKENQYYIDRTQSGKTAFEQDFAATHVAPRLVASKGADISLIIDVSSVELFADKGLTVMTEIFFPNDRYDQLHFDLNGKIVVDELQFIQLRSIWK